MARTKPTPKPRRVSPPVAVAAAPAAAPVPTPASLARLARLDEDQVGGSHYRDMPVTPWQFLESALSPDEMRGYLKAEVIVYLARERQKGGREDMRKAAHTLAKLLEVTAAEG